MQFDCTDSARESTLLLLLVLTETAVHWVPTATAFGISVLHFWDNFSQSSWYRDSFGLSTVILFL